MSTAGPTDVTALSCLFLGLFVLIFSLWSRVIKENLYLSGPILCTLFGVLLSKSGLGLLAYVPDDWDHSLVDSAARRFLMWLCRIIIGTQVFFAASTLPGRWLGKKPNQQSMAMLLLPVMTSAWLVSSALLKACFPTMLWTEALIIGACIAPTDPVLASSVVKGTFAERHVPEYVRQLLSAESGLNDGFGTPFLFIPIFSVLNGFRPLETLVSFLLQIVLYDVLCGSALGVAIGYLARKRLKIARRKGRIDRESMLIFSTALALFTVGLGEVLGTNGLLACFFAGIAVNWTSALGPEMWHSPFNEGVELLFDAAVFFVLGVILPVNTWLDASFLPLSRLVLAATLILLLRRLPAVLVLSRFIPVLHNTNEAVFAGYFGPIGVSALYYALIATHRLPDDYERRDKIIAVTTFIIFSSVVVHGISAPLYIFMRSLAARLSNPPNATDNGEAVGDGDTPDEITPLLGTSRIPTQSWRALLYARLTGTNNKHPTPERRAEEEVARESHRREGSFYFALFCTADDPGLCTPIPWHGLATNQRLHDTNLRVRSVFNA